MKIEHIKMRSQKGRNGEPIPDMNIAFYQFIDGKQWAANYNRIEEFDEKAFIARVKADLLKELQYEKH